MDGLNAFMGHLLIAKPWWTCTRCPIQVRYSSKMTSTGLPRQGPYKSIKAIGCCNQARADGLLADCTASHPSHLTPACFLSSLRESLRERKGKGKNIDKYKYKLFWLCASVEYPWIIVYYDQYSFHFQGVTHELRTYECSSCQCLAQ